LSLLILSSLNTTGYGQSRLIYAIDDSTVAMPIRDFRLAIEAHVTAQSLPLLEQHYQELVRVDEAIIEDRERQLGHKDTIIDEMKTQLRDAGPSWYDHFWIGALTVSVGIAGILVLTN